MWREGQYEVYKEQGQLLHAWDGMGWAGRLAGALQSLRGLFRRADHLQHALQRSWNCSARKSTIATHRQALLLHDLALGLKQPHLLYSKTEDEEAEARSGVGKLGGGHGGLATMQVGTPGAGLGNPAPQAGRQAGRLTQVLLDVAVAPAEAQGAQRMQHMSVFVCPRILAGW